MRGGIRVYVTYNDPVPADRSRRDLIVQFYDANRALGRYLPLEQALLSDPAMQDVRLDAAEHNANVWVAKRTVHASVALADLTTGSTCDGLARRAATAFNRFLRY